MLVDRFTTLGRRYRHFHRYREIATVLLRHGFGDLVRRVGMHRYLRLGRWRAQGQGQAYIPTRAERVRLALEELGPSFVKLGQALSMRRDLIPPYLITELEKLQDAVPPFPGEQARQIVESEMKRPIHELFRTFNETPLASASIAQVHEAVTIAGERVVVKIRRPRIETTMATDLEIMADMGELVERFVPEAAVFEPVRIVREFRKIMQRELDFCAEAGHIERFAHNFAGDTRIYVPRVFRDLTTERILTMEFIDGLKVTRTEEFAARGLDAKVLAHRGAELVLEQVFIHGFFHADPHPGNILVLPNNVFCLLDYGMTGSLTARQREQLSDLIIGLTARDERRVAQAVFHLSGYHRVERIAAVEADILSFLETYASRPLGELQIGAILNDLARLLIRYDIHLPPEFFVLTKALATIESVGRALSPGFEVMTTAEPFARRLLRERLNVRRLLRQTGSALLELQGFIRELPGQAGELIDQFKHGDVRLKFEHRGLENLTHVLDRVSNRIAFAIVLAALLIGSALMVHSGIPPKWHGLPVIGVAGFCVSGIMGFSLLYSILKHGRM